VAACSYGTPRECMTGEFREWSKFAAVPPEVEGKGKTIGTAIGGPFGTGETDQVFENQNAQH
jgi:hypothetical protein